jgi:hypothetical protein
MTEHDDRVTLPTASNEFVRHAVQFVFDRSGLLVAEAFDGLRSRTHLCLPDALGELPVVFRIRRNSAPRNLCHGQRGMC